MGFIEILNDNWYIFFFGIIILIFYYAKSKNKNVLNFDNESADLIINGLLFLIVIIFCQDKFFNEHGYFIIGLIFFCPFYMIFIWFLLNRGNYYLIESRIQGQEFYKLGLIPGESGIEKEITMNTGIKIHVMDKEVYEAKNQYGDDFTPRYNAGNQIKFCDYFNGETIYHPEYPDLKNISFWARIVEFVHLKDMIPDLMRENLTLTDLANVKILKHTKTIRKNLDTTLTGLENQYEKEPYNIENKIKEHLDKKMAEKHTSLTESESKDAIKNKNTKEVELNE